MWNIIRGTFFGLVAALTILLILGAGANAISVSNVTNKTPMATTVWILWNASTEANNTVEYSINSDLSNASFSSWYNNTSTPEIKLWSLQPNKKYYYRVWSYNATNESDNISSSIHNFTTQECVSYKLVNATDTSITGIDHPIQEAIDMICYEGGTVHLKNGTFTVSENKGTTRFQGGNYGAAIIIIKSNLTLEGDDPYSTIIRLEDNNSNYYFYLIYGGIIIKYSSETPYPIVINVTIQNIQLDANKRNNPKHILGVNGSFGIKINSRYSIYKNIIMNDTSLDGIYLHGDHNDIIDCQGELIGHDAVRLNGNTYSNVINFTNNFENPGYGNNIVRLTNCQYCTLDNIRGLGGDTAIQFTTAGSGHCAHNILKNSVLTTAPSSAWYGVVLHIQDSGSTYNNTIINTIIWNTFKDGIRIETGVKNTTIENCVIYNSRYSGIKIDDASGTGTIIKNSIIADNAYYGINGDATSTYNDIWNNTLGNYNGTSAGTGDISEDPLFADPDNSDFHLKSQAGRWNGTDWVYDNETSPCVDAGDPNSSYSNESYPHGQRINIGAYGNTTEASKSPYHKIYLSVPMTIYSNGEYSYPEPPITYKDNQTVNITFNVSDTTNLTINSYTSSQISFTATNTTTDQKMNITIYNGTFIVVNGKKYEIKKDGVVQQTKTASDNKVVFTDIPVGSDYVITESGDNGYTVTLAQGYNMLAWTSTTPTNSSELCNEVPNCSYVYKKNPDGSWTAKQCGYPGGEFTISRGFGFLAYVTEACEWTRDE